MRHGGTALDAAEARGHENCAEVIRKVGGRHSMQRTLGRLTKVGDMGEIGEEDGGVFFFF